LRILKDDPGSAALYFDRALDAPRLEISIRSLREFQKDRGRGGQWRETPDDICVERIESDPSSTRYKVGPEIFNQFLENTKVQGATVIGDLREVGAGQKGNPALKRRAGAPDSQYAVGATPPSLKPTFPLTAPPAPDHGLGRPAQK
jgi:hypothetical protein